MTMDELYKQHYGIEPPSRAEFKKFLNNLYGDGSISELSKLAKEDPVKYSQYMERVKVVRDYAAEPTHRVTVTAENFEQIEKEARINNRLH